MDYQFLPIAPKTLELKGTSAFESPLNPYQYGYSSWLIHIANTPTIPLFKVLYQLVTDFILKRKITSRFYFY